MTASADVSRLAKIHQLRLAGLVEAALAGEDACVVCFHGSPFEASPTWKHLWFANGSVCNPCFNAWYQRISVTPKLDGSIQYELRQWKAIYQEKLSDAALAAND